MSLQRTRWISFLLIGVTLAIAVYVTFFGAHRGGLELGSDIQDGATTRHGEIIPLEMKSLTELYRTINLVQKRYIDATRINPRLMFTAAVRAVQKTVSKVLVREEGERLAVTVGAKKRMFALDDIATPWVLLQRVKDVFAFLGDELDKEDFDVKEAEYVAINGMLQTLDPHSVFLDPDQYREMTDRTRGKFGGLGIVISIRDGVLTIISPIAGTPADAAGLEAGDQIVKIDEQSTVNMSLNDAVDLLRGEPSTKVTVHILRKGWAESRPFRIARAIVKVESLEYQMLKGRIGYIKIKDFQGNTPADVGQKLVQWREKGISGLVLDLRGCPGGLLEAAIKVSDIFLKSGVIVTTAGQGPSDRDIRRAGDSGDEPDYPLIVLVNRGSASASEIVAGALKNHNRALLVGERTFGKGSVQVLFEFGDENGEKPATALKLTTAQYLTPGDLSIQSVGVVPHVKLEPMIADKQTFDLKEEDGARESDLDHHFEAARASDLNDRPARTLSYLRTTRGMTEGEEADGGVPDDLPSENRAFKPDFAIELARELALKMARTEQKSPRIEDLSNLLLEKAATEETRLVAALDKLGINWRLGTDSETVAKATVTAELAGGHELEAGKEAEMTLTVTNEGPGTYYRLLATSRSDLRSLHERELPFGKVAPGETVTRSLKFRVPKDTLGQVDDVLWSFESSSNSPPPSPIVHRFYVKPLKRPHFAYSYYVRDGSGGNGDGALQPGESADLVLVVKNVGKGVALNTYATLKSFSGKNLFMIKGREHLKKIEPDTWRRGVFAFDIKPEFEDKEAHFELGLADVDLRVYSVEKLSIPVLDHASTEPVPNIVFPDGGPLPEALSVNAPPKLEIELMDKVVRTPTITIKGRAIDETRVQDVFIFVGEDKVFFKPNVDAHNPEKLSFEAELPLENGINYITVFAEETSALDTREVITVRRDHPSGMPYFHALSLNGDPELVQIAPTGFGR